MNDLHGALRSMADRGTVVGSETLRQRVLVDLAAIGTRRFPSISLRPLSGPVIALAAAAIVLIAIGAFALFGLLGGEEAPVITEPPPVTTVPPPPSTTAPPTTTPPTTLPATTMPPTTVAPTTTVPPTATAPPPSAPAMAWERAPDQEALEASWMTGVVPGGPGLVAVGYVMDDPAVEEFADWESDAAIWVSSDGLTWERVDDPDIPSGGTFQEIQDVATGPLGIAAVVTMYNEPDVVLISSDGLAWDRIEDDDLEEVRAITAGGPGWVGVGGDRTTGNAVVVVSEDGLSWDRIEDDDLVGGFGSDALLIWDVASGGPGLVAVGRVGLNASATGAVWVSSDGLEWERIPDDVIGAARQVERVAADPVSGDLVAFGHSVWTSTDGREWLPSIDPESFPLEQPAGNAAAVWDGDRIIAGGGDGVLWVSPNRGASWARIDSAAAAIEDMIVPWISGIVQFGDRFVAVGGEGVDFLGGTYAGLAIGADGAAAVWIGEWNE